MAVSFIEEHQSCKKRNEWEEKYASGLIENYDKASKVPFGTTDCENNPESPSSKKRLSLKRVASTSREKFWRDNHATNI